MDELTAEMKEKLSRALGEAVVGIWSNLPQDVQHALFEEVAASQGESVRHQLAIKPARYWSPTAWEASAFWR